VQGRRKALLFFSEGFDYDIYQPFDLAPESSAIISDTRQAAAAAQRANVNIYGVDPRGLSNFGEMININARSDYPQLDFGNFRGELNELRLSQDSLRVLADETGGFALVSTNDFDRGLARIDAETSDYYVIGYYSSNTDPMPRLRQISVTVTRPGVEVKHRRGYSLAPPR